MKKFYFVCLVMFLSCVFLCACGETIDNSEKEDDRKVTILNEKMIVAVGEEVDLNFSVDNFEYKIAYSEYDNTIIKVVDETIKGLKEGSTVLKVTITDMNDETKVFTESIPIEVKEERQVTISYSVNVNGKEMSSDTIKYGSDYTLKEAPVIEGYEFLGYSLKKTDTTYITNIEAVKKNTTIYANYVFIHDPVVTYIVNGTELENETKEVKKGTKVNPSLVSVTDSGFIGWVSDAGLPVIITGEVEINSDTTFTAVFSKQNYKISYNLNGGSWVKVYYTIDELCADFLADYNKNGGNTTKIEQLDTNFLDSGAFAAAYSKTAMKTKWMWLYKALCEHAKKMDTLNPETVDLTSYAAKSFYISAICGFLSKTQHKDTNFGTTSVDYSLIENQLVIINKSTPKSEQAGPTSYQANTSVQLVNPVRVGYEFVGWTINGQDITNIASNFVGDVKVVAKWKQAQLPEEFKFLNIPSDGIKLYESLQLTWEVGPVNAYDKEVYFQALDPSIFTIDEKGLVTTISNGTGRVKVKFTANSKFEEIVSITVTKGDYFDISYETTSYTTVGESIILNSSYYNLKGEKCEVTWESLTPDIATVEGNGIVIPVKTGLATIRSKYDATHYIDFVVTVLDKNISDELQFVLNNHNSNALTVYDLNVGGTYTYDVVGSVNDLLFDQLKIDKTYYDKLPSGTKNYGTMKSVEFICVHYTGNMAKGADADNNCDYFNNLSYQASIHYVTGRSNLYSSYNEDQYYAFAGLNEKYAGWHASTGQNECIWDATGVLYQSTDPVDTEISISKNLKYTINGKETQISIPEVPSGYSINGNVLTYNGSTYTTINSMGLISKVVDGQYYIARTYWGSQRSPKALCTYGGNTNSIGIESCVDIGNDLVHTWHVTAQLVAQLILKYDLGFDRVVGHHFFSAKNCPQPMLENDMQLWYEFMDMVKAEYALLTIYKDYKVTAKAVQSEGILSNKGLLKQDSQSHIVTYEVTIEKAGVKQTITLATAVESYYCYEGKRNSLSLQNIKYDIQ